MDKKIFFLILFLYLIIQFLTFRTGIGQEDFRDVEVFKQVNNGLVPYRDINWDYGILGLYLWAFIIKLFGSELIILRLCVILIGAIGILFVYDLSRRIMSKGFSLLAAFSCFAVFSFPSASFNHYLSVPCLVIAIWYAYKFFCDKKKIDIFMWGVLLTAVFYIRPIPTGIAMVISSLFAIIIFSLQRAKPQSFFKNIIYLFSPFLAISIFIYFVTDGLFFEYVISHATAINVPTLIFGLPNTIKQILAFIYASKIFNLADINTIYKILSFFNILSGHVVYWVIFIMPTCYVTIMFIRLLLRRQLGKLNDKNLLVIFLCILNFLMCLYFHKVLLKTDWPDLGGSGLGWIKGVGQYLLQSGIIVSSYLLFVFFNRIKKRLIALTTCSALVFSLVLIPKIIDLRYIIRKMPIGQLSGVKWVYLNDFYAHGVIPAIEYINNKKDIPEEIFVIGYFPAFYALLDKKPLIQEHVWITDLINPANDYSLSKNEKILFPGEEKKLLDKNDLDNIILNRLRAKLPCVIQQPFGSFLDDNLKWVQFFKNNYRPVKTFGYKRAIAEYIDTDTDIVIYLPKN